jgi:hypothetical protein
MFDWLYSAFLSFVTWVLALFGVSSKQPVQGGDQSEHLEAAPYPPNDPSPSDSPQNLP